MLKKSVFVALPVLVTGLAIGLAVPASSGSSIQPKLSEKEQSRLDSRLEGRVAGKAVSCISRREGEDMTVISDDIILFQRGRSAKTVYLNKPRGGCYRAKHNALVRRSNAGSFCSGEVVEITDLRNGSFMGTCSWSEFVPYTKADKS